MAPSATPDPDAGPPGAPPEATDGATPAPSTGLVRATAVMSAGTALSRMTGFVRLAVMAWAIGGTESKVPDTYNLANQLPNIVYQLVLGEILATVFVPVFVEYIHTRKREESWQLASTILNLSIVVGAAFAVVTVIFAPQIIRLYTFHEHNPIVRAQEISTGAFFMRLFMPQMIFYAAGAVLTGLLNAHRRFAAPMFAPVLNNAIVIGTFVLFRAVHGSHTPQLATLTGAEKWILAGGTTLGVVAFTMVLWPFVLTLPGKYRPRAFDWSHPSIRHVGRLAKYSFGYVIVNQIGLWVVFALANDKQGGISAFLSAYTLYQLPYGIFAVSVMTALVTSLAEHHVRGDDDRFRSDVSLGLRTTAFIVMPAAAGFIALGEPITKLLLQHGVFGASSTKLFADTLILMSIGLAFFAAFQQLMRAFYARQDTRTPWRVNLWATAFNVAINFPLFWWLGVPGLALAHALSYVVAAIVSGELLRRRIGGIDGRRLVSAHARIAAASAVTAAISWWIARSLGHLLQHGADLSVQGRLVQVGVAVVAGMGIYAALAAAMRLDEFRPLIRMVKARFERT